MDPPNDDPWPPIDALIESCLHAPLDTDVGINPPDAAASERFRAVLDQRLQQLFASLQSLTDTFHPLHTGTLLVLLCFEQTAPDFVDPEDDELQAATYTQHASNRRRLTELRVRIAGWLIADASGELRTRAFGWYKQRITASHWKRNPAAAFGLGAFVRCAFEWPPALNTDEALFLLAAASLTMEHFETPYKLLALSLFDVLLTHIGESDARQTNIAEPIFAQCICAVGHLQGLAANRLLWHCLQLCLRRMSPDASAWNRCDDAADALLTRLAFESKREMRTLFIDFVPAVLAPDFNGGSADWPELRQQCIEAGVCLRAGRWTQKLVKSIVYHVSCCFAFDRKTAHDAAQDIRGVHRVYLSTLFAVPASLCGRALREFAGELPAALVRLQRNGPEGPEGQPLRTEIQAFLESLVQHFLRSKPPNEGFFLERAKTMQTLLLEMSDRQIPISHVSF